MPLTGPSLVATLAPRGTLYSRLAKGAAWLDGVVSPDGASFVELDRPRSTTVLSNPCHRFVLSFFFTFSTWSTAKTSPVFEILTGIGSGSGGMASSLCAGASRRLATKRDSSLPERLNVEGSTAEQFPQFGLPAQARPYLILVRPPVATDFGLWLVLNRAPDASGSPDEQTETCHGLDDATPGGTCLRYR